ncbi:tRNA (adenosine(37)-N6)-threonylcarbamoyltransferase complex transferase subunit TsaD, partial [Alphaproteobacteria bacterium]|nr:tRNA (adenosine(37)-N6)-threonylcarbamoyltransferase complex transferase subunit TsaD [Alphaproteobacteria bacterium]
QDDIHQIYMGIVPELAARNHVFHIDKITNKALKSGNIKLNNIDIIASTAGPGLIGGLLVGLSFAKTLAQVGKIPFVAINHLEGHVLTPRLAFDIKFPYLVLLISGGHSNFYFLKDINNYNFIGGTLDDAVGETFDKIGKALGLKFPGGPEVEIRASEGDENAFIFPKPLLKKADSNINLSFSGLKSHVIKLINNNKRNLLSKSFIDDISASFQKTISDILINKLKRAINFCNRKYPVYETVAVVGGVASNNYLRDKFVKAIINCEKKAFIPSPYLCTDNGAMIAWAGYERFRLGYTSSLNFKALPRWPLEKGNLYE